MVGIIEGDLKSTSLAMNETNFKPLLSGKNCNIQPLQLNMRI